MDAHEINERFRLLTHRVYAQRIDEDPTLIARAATAIQQTIEHGEPTLGERMWSALLTLPATTIKASMLDCGPEGRLLRSNSPFSELIGVTDIEDRRALWKQAQNEP